MGFAKRDCPIEPAELGGIPEETCFRWQVDEPYYTYKNAILRGENPFKGTESGKIEFYSQELAASSNCRKG
jgi:hypothetical protein